MRKNQIQEFDQEDLPSLGLRAYRVNRQSWDGGCNFCQLPNLKIFQVEGNGIKIRFCADCLKELRAQTGRV